jgi:PQQ-dependent dehydrogenase (methanol/ethanol family)
VLACLLIQFPLGSRAQEMPAGSGDNLFNERCTLCHGSGAQGTDRGPALANNRRLRMSSEADLMDLIKNGRANMPSFSFLAADQLQALAGYVHGLNATVFETHPAGDIDHGKEIFFGGGQCITCHTAHGTGGDSAPDLSNIARSATVGELTRALRTPGKVLSPGYGLADLTLTDGSTLHGFVRERTADSVALQTMDGRLHLLNADEYRSLTLLSGSAMPAFTGPDSDLRDLVAYLSTLGGVRPGADSSARGTISEEDQRAVTDPGAGEWPTYSGRVTGNRHSTLKQVNVHNVATLTPAWVRPLPYAPLEVTPLVVAGVMYTAGPNQVYALDARTGAQIWEYTRPRSPASEISGDAVRGASRGVAILGHRVFYITDNAHLISLNALTGALLWEVSLPSQPGRFGGTSAPLVVGDLVVAGISGGDEGVHGFIAAYRAASGEEAWRFWTVPKAGEALAKTWEGDSDPQGGASWTTPSYDPETGALYVSTGNPWPDTDGDARAGDNLYTDSDLALDAKTGKLLWYFQYTPHDIHDWDANQPIVLVDVPYDGKPRKLLLHANRNGFFYVLDRINGQLLHASAFVKKLTWASGVGTDGRPQLLPGNEVTSGGVEACPAVRGATNWYSTAYDPQTRLYYVMSVEDCSVYRKSRMGGFGPVNHPDDPGYKVLRALSVDSGKIVWEMPMVGPTESNYSGVMSTDGGIVVFGDSSGGIVAADARNGHVLWRFQANQIIKASPMTYTVSGRQYISIASGSNILVFALPVRQPTAVH